MMNESTTREFNINPTNPFLLFTEKILTITPLTGKITIIII